MIATVLAVGLAFAGETGVGFTRDHVAKMNKVTSFDLSPDGDRVAYVLQVPLDPYAEGNGSPWKELHVVGPGPGTSRPFVTGEVKISGVRWKDDGSGIFFLQKREGDDHRSLYFIPVDGGEAASVLEHRTDISSYSWSPDGKRVAFLATEQPDESWEKLEKKGFNAGVVEERWDHVRVWIAEPGVEDVEPRMLDLPGSASRLQWSPAGDRLVVALAATPSLDDQYMYRKLRVVDPVGGAVVARIDNVGKLGAVVWSPDGKHLAFTSGEDIHDPSEGRLMVAPAAGGAPRDLLPGYTGEVESIAWRTADTVMFVASEGVWSTLAEVNLTTGDRTNLVPAGRQPNLGALSLSRDGSKVALRADAPTHRDEVFFLARGDAAPVRWTDVNPWMADVRFAEQEVVRYTARDGLEIEGILVRPLDEVQGKRYPLILSVHGGPESHVSNGWVTRYSRPGQVGAARGFAVFYPNYRGSTGRGVPFSKMGQADYAGGEFDDLVDAVDHLVKTGLADREKVGVIGGSYGGFAAAWCATALSEHFAAAVMFAGISDHVSKAGTTDVPMEMYLVHSRRWPWEHWDWFRQRSPLYHVEKGRTPILIVHGEKDARVHVSQAMEFYRYLKLLGKVPVRLVLYPDEGHGCSKAAGRYDYSMRSMRWLEHYLKGPGGDPPPPDLPLDEARLGE